MNRKRNISFSMITFVLIFERTAYGDWIQENSFIDLAILLLYIIGIWLFFHSFQECKNIDR
jgi:hypothetical protein